MKKLMMLLISLSSSPLLADFHETNWANKYAKFMGESKKDKLEWFDFVKEMKTKKIDLLKKHKDEWFNYGIKNVKKWEDTDIKNQKDKDEIFKEQLEQAIKIRKNHANHWKEYWNKFQEEGDAIYEDHRKKIKSFEDLFKTKQEKNDDDDEDDDED